MFDIRKILRRKKRIGLALGSGAARGLTHIGVLKAIQDLDIGIDVIAGSSIGALIGACYAIKGDVGGIEEIIVNTDFKSMLSLIDLNVILTHKGFIRGDKVKELLSTVIGDLEFKDLEIPMIVLATDVETGEEVMINEGPVVEAVRASISIPVAFVPVKYKGRFLMDGGMANPVPVDVARRMGADFVIACDVSKSAQTKNSREKHVNPQNIINIEKYKNTLKETGVYKEFNRKLNDFLSENSDLAKKHKQIMGRISQLTSKGSEAIDKDTPDIFYTLAQALFSMEARVIKSYLKNADLVIRPDTDNIDTYDFHKGNEAIEKGYSSAAAALAKLVKRGL